MKKLKILLVGLGIAVGITTGINVYGESNVKDDIGVRASGTFDVNLPNNMGIYYTGSVGKTTTTPNAVINITSFNGSNGVHGQVVNSDNVARSDYVVMVKGKYTVQSSTTINYNYKLLLLNGYSTTIFKDHVAGNWTPN